MTGDAANVLLGVLIAAVANGALLWCGHLVARRFWPEGRASARLVATGTVWLALVVSIVHLLGAAGALSRWAVLVPAVGLAVVCHLVWGRSGDARGESRCAAGWVRTIGRSRGGLLLLGAALLLAFAAIRAATRPPLSWDSLTYHNTFAATWVQSGGLARIALPPAMAGLSHLPTHFEALVTWVMLPFHSDFLANFANFPLLVLAAASVYGLCREFGLDVYDGALAAGLACLSPAVLAYVATQYNDVLVMSQLTAAVLFMVRSVRGRGWPDAVAAFAACGLAVGTKYTALPAAALVGAIVVIGAVGRRPARWRRGLATLGLAIAIPVLLGGSTYLRNAQQTGNPIYPASVRLFGIDILRGASPMTEARTRTAYAGTWRNDAAQLARSATYVHRLRHTPLTWGPKLPGLVVLALLALFLARRAAFRVELWAAALCWIVPAALFYLDPSASTASARRFWQESSCRFIAPSVALMAVGALVAVSMLPWARARRIARACLCGFLLYDLFVMCIVPDSPSVLLAVAVGLPILVAALLALRGLSHSRGIFSATVAGVALLALVLGAPALQRFRDAKRNRFFATRVDLHPIPTHYARGWAFCDEPREPKTIALVSFEPLAGHHWFFYPLMGRRLQNTVLYVPADRQADDAAAWLEALRESQVTHLFVQLSIFPDKPGDTGEPHEMAWIRARPDLFRLADEGCYYSVFTIQWPGEPG